MSLKLLFIGITLVAVAPYSYCHSQEERLTARTIQEDKKSNDSLNATAAIDPIASEQYSRPMNALKINASSLLSRNFSFQYERHLTKRLSVAIGYRIMPRMGVPFKSEVIKAIANSGDMGQDEKNTITNFVNNVSLGGSAITPEIRIYTRKNNTGFYVAPFVRYEAANIAASYLLQIDNNEYDLKFTGHYRNLGAGLLLGWSFNIGKRFAIDWWIMGPYIGSMKTNINAFNFHIPLDDYVEYQEEINNFRFENEWFKSTASATQNDANIKIEGIMPGVRAMGINFVVKF